VSISNDGNTIAASARLGDPRGGEDAGYVRVFTYSGALWSQLGSDIEGRSFEEELGRSVAMDSTGRIVAVGVFVTTEPGRGRVRVFRYSGGSWDTVGDPIDGDNDYDRLGTSVSLSESGAYLAAGAHEADANGNENSGMVQVYHYDGSSWNKRGPGIPGEAESAKMGYNQITLSNDAGCLAVGAMEFDNGQGKGYLFRWEWSEYVKVGEVVGDGINDKFGESATVSGDCQWAAWGGPSVSGSDDSGYVHVVQVED